HQKNLETLLEADVDQGISEIKEPHFKQPEWAKDLIRLHWVQSAYASGDRSWKATPYADFISKSISPIIY
ncbi:MAG TPA: hypothetical protein VMW41_06975, partial [Candidatus Bathyarchaeia archaeon]|nr:hypothetical protein [Candidatus Bathyarchaeia archaeon]